MTLFAQAMIGIAIALNYHFYYKKMISACFFSFIFVNYRIIK